MSEFAKILYACDVKTQITIQNLKVFLFKCRRDTLSRIFVLIIILISVSYIDKIIQK